MNGLDPQLGSAKNAAGCLIEEVDLTDCQTAWALNKRKRKRGAWK